MNINTIFKLSENPSNEATSSELEVGFCLIFLIILTANVVEAFVILYTIYAFNENAI